MKAGNIFAELKRRNVYKVGIAYALVCWGVIQVATQVFPVFGIPPGAVRLVAILLAAGLPIALVFAWVFEVTPEGLKRTEEVPLEASITRSTGRKLDFAIIGILLLVIAVLLARRNGHHPPAPLAGIPEKSIALLPFENLSRDPENAYFAEGIQDEILSRLVKIADLKVISRTSTHQYKNAPQNLQEIGKQLAVATVLEGTVQRVEDQVRVNVQLLNAATDGHLWSDIYDREVSNIFELESEIAQKIAQSLQAKLSAPELQRLAVRPTNNGEAYDAYLRGLVVEGSNLYSGGNLMEAIGFYQKAVRADPKFGLAWARLSRASARMYFSGDDKSAARRGEAQHALEQAATLEPSSPETLLAHAYFQYWVKRDFEAAKSAFTRVRELLPGDSEVPSALARITRRQGHWDQSISYWEQTVALDPRNREWLTDMAWTFSMLRQFPLALKTYARALEIDPSDADLSSSIAEIHQAEGNLSEARKSLAGINAVTVSSEAFVVKVIEFFFERNHAEAIRLLQARLRERPDLEFFELGTNQQLLAYAQQLFGDTVVARATAAQAQRTLEAARTNDPDNPNVAAALARVYALLGNRELALSEAKRATSLRPTAKDAVIGPAYEENLALVEASVGNADEAIARLKRLLEIPYNSIRYGNAPLTRHLLKLDPAWDPLRSDSRFQQLTDRD